MLLQTFSINRDEVACGEYFSHTAYPMLTINSTMRTLYINTAGLKHLPEIEFALILISQEDKRLSIFPCDGGERDAIRLRSRGNNLNKPRKIRFREEFWDYLSFLTKWKSDRKYRMIGYVASNGVNKVIAFDLTSAEVFLPGERIPNISKSASGRFGKTFEELHGNPLVKRAGQDLEFSIRTEDKSADENG